MISLDNNKTENTGEVPAVEEISVPSGKKAALKDLMSYVISAEFYAAILFTVCAVMCLFICNRGGEAIAALAGLFAAVLCVVFSERQHRDLMNLDRTTFRKLMYSVYSGKYLENGLRLSLVIRLAPIALGFVSIIICLIRALLGGVGEYGTLLSVMATFMASAALGIELPAVIAVSGGIVTLKQQDIEVSDPEKLGTAARAKYVLADKSVFFASKGTETGGVYIRGKAYGVSELSFSEAYPLLAAIYVCDDGGLSAAFGFRQQITDGLLRALRTTQFEHSSRFMFHVLEHSTYDPARGYACARCIDPEGEEKTYFVGKPDALLGALKYDTDEIGLRPIGDADMRYLRLHLRRTYSAGREVMMVAESAEDRSGLVLIGLLNMNCIISEEARESVRELRAVGVEPVYVSEENENCAFYHARELGVARDMSQVLTGARIERFRKENLVRAAKHARLCAEAEAPHRRALTRLLAEDRVIMSASRSGNDELLRLADVRVTSPSGEYSTDLVCRNCSIEDVSLVARVARSLCAVARRAEYQLFCAPICAMLLCLFTVAAYGTVPFGVAAMFFVCAVLPLPQMLVTAKMNVGPAKGIVMSFMMDKKKVSDAPVTAGLGLAGWNLLNCLGTAVCAAYIYGSYISVESVGVGGASAAAFLTVGAYMLVNNLICRVWGKSCISLKDENGGAKFVVVSLLVLAVVLIIAMVGGLSEVFAMSVLPYKRVPLTLAPAAVSLLIYEVGGAILRHRKSHSEK